MPSLARLRDLHAQYDGPVPAYELVECDERFGRGLAMREHHHLQAKHFRKCVEYGQESAKEDLSWHAKQVWRWHRYLWDLRRNG